MSRQMLEVMQRRGELLARIAAQREDVAKIGARLKTPLKVADGVLVVAHFLRSHPLIPAGVAGLFVVRSQGVIGLAKAGWKIWKGYRFISSISEKLSSKDRVA